MRNEEHSWYHVRIDLTYVALLRGINLSGHKIVKMDQLRKAFEDLGFEDVKTYIQSGNVVFRAPPRACQDLAKRIEEKVLRQFGFPVPVVVKTAGEIGEVIRDNPLLKEKDIDLSKLHVTFLSCAPDKSALKMLDGVAALRTSFTVRGRQFISIVRTDTHESKLANNVLEKMLKVGTTTRNWRTVNKL